MAAVTVNASMGTNPLVAAGTAGSGTALVTDLYGLHSLGEGMTQTGIIFVINISAYTSGNLTVAVAGLSSSGYTWTILSSAALSSAATTTLSIGAGIAVTSNVSASALVPNQLQITATGASTPSFTYGIDYCIAV